MSRSADRAGRGPAAFLKPARDRSVAQRHPWIFAGSIDRVSGDPQGGDTVTVMSAGGEALALAAYSPSSQIRARVWTFDPGEGIDAAFLARRVERAAASRASMFDAKHDAARLVHGESDGLPGIVADRYAGSVVMQLTSAGAERWRAEIVAALANLPGVTCVYERSDAEVRTLEGLSPRTGVAYGELPRDLAIVENGIAYGVDPVAGQKTGFYLDQRDNRRIVRALARGRRVLNVFCYTGGFTLAALAGDADRATSIDSSADAIAQARANVARNASLDASRSEWIEADAFVELRRLRNAGAMFDLIVLDPPKFAPTAAHAERAARAYKDVNLLALKMLEPGGNLATFSCSGGVSADLFQKIVAGAAVDAKADVQIVRKLGASADHPVALSFPEGEYLKGLLLRKG
ncbi:MAG: class I SAM-dependent methyltransferase [Casimicrobiaceae bacterium]